MTRIGKCGHCGTGPWTEGSFAPCDDSYCTFPYFETNTLKHQSVEITSHYEGGTTIETIDRDYVSTRNSLRGADIWPIFSTSAHITTGDIEAPPAWLSFIMPGGDECGRLEIKDGVVTFSGNADEAAQVFFKNVVETYDATVIGLRKQVASLKESKE